MWQLKTPEQIEKENLEQAKDMKANEVSEQLRKMERWANIYIDEYTYDDLRIDAIIIDTEHKWLRGFEIKVTRSDFLNDEKWENYSCFCSSLSVVCPWGLIQKEEINKPFGLLWVSRNGCAKWVRRPKNFQKREALAWRFLYYRVIETEFKRLYWGRPTAGAAK
ncbi:MAG: hypothetical protein ABII25_00340 [bacterium]